MAISFPPHCPGAPFLCSILLLPLDLPSFALSAENSDVPLKLVLVLSNMLNAEESYFFNSDQKLDLTIYSMITYAIS